MADYIEIKAPPKNKSAVWKHFGHPVYVKGGVKTADTTLTVCKIDQCRAMIKYTGNTTNMAAHLRRHHPSVWSSPCTQPLMSKQSTQKPSQSSIITPSTSSNGTSSVPSTTGQLRLNEAFRSRYSINAPRAKAITKQIGTWIASGMHPFRVVEEKHFRKILKLTDERYELPQRKYFSEKVIPNLYRDIKEKVTADISRATSSSVTTDGWTSRNVNSYITITCHFMRSNWTIANYVLQTRMLPISHTGENIGQVLLDAKIEWGLDKHKGVAVITDNASNMGIAAEKGQLYPHIKCLAHTVNLAAQRGLQVSAASRLLGRVKRVVNFFHRSSTANCALSEKQKMLQLPQHKLINDVPTRWNSSYDMLERFHEQQLAIIAVLFSPEIKKNAKDVMTLSDEDYLIIEQLIVILKTLKTVTLAICDESNCTISLILPLMHKIRMNMRPIDLDSKLVGDVKAAVLKDLRNRYEEEEMKNFLLLASVLDARFRSLPFLSDREIDQVYIHLKENVIDYVNEITENQNAATAVVKTEPDGADIRQPGPSNSQQPEPLLPNLPADAYDSSDSTTLPSFPQFKEDPTNDGDEPPFKKSAMECLFDDVYVTKVTGPVSKSTLAAVDEEISQYKQESTIQVSGNPLHWWKENERRFPLLACFAKKMLSIPGTSVPSERVFSTAGDIVTAQRAQLKSENVDILIFLKKNIDLFE